MPMPEVDSVAPGRDRRGASCRGTIWDSEIKKPTGNVDPMVCHFEVTEVTSIMKLDR